MLRSQITQLNCTKVLEELFVGLTMTMTAIILLTLPGMDNAYTQSTLMSPSTNSNSIAQQHTEHILDNLVISEYIP
jgi:hypothetical protein